MQAIFDLTLIQKTRKHIEKYLTLDHKNKDKTVTIDKALQLSLYQEQYLGGRASNACYDITYISK